MARSGSTLAAWIYESSSDTEDLTLAGKEKRRNKEKLLQKRAGQVSQETLTNQPPSTETTFSKLFSQPGSWKERDAGGDNAINFHSAFAKYRQGHFKDF